MSINFRYTDPNYSCSYSAIHSQILSDSPGVVLEFRGIVLCGGKPKTDPFFDFMELTV